ncbi:MAG TPA: hypothetical protein VGT79_04295, partial [Xanthomonadaceae bacterium]|nr:hypothetical protein [Xanthomonadaceae bacterium]
PVLATGVEESVAVATGRVEALAATFSFKAFMVIPWSVTDAGGNPSLDWILQDSRRPRVRKPFNGVLV